MLKEIIQLTFSDSQNKVQKYDLSETTRKNKCPT
jgi:hypothetical protein